MIDVELSIKDFKSYRETAYLMASAKNAERLNESIRQLESKQARSHSLLDLAEPS